jgi:hypothetical protein
MARFWLLLVNEFKLARTALPIHMVSIIQPPIFFLLMSIILVHPTFTVHVTQPTSEEGYALVAAMQEVGPPIGEDYIDPVIVDVDEPGDLLQVITVEARGGIPTAVQRFGLIDSNQVKNFRNRLTAAALRLWNDSLGGRAVTIEEHPWLPYDIPYMVYFGLAMLPVATFMSGVLIGGTLTAQDFEFKTIMEYRTAPTSPALLLAARVIRLMLTTLIAAGILLLVIGWRSGYWPAPIWRLGLVLLPMTIIASCLGITLALVFRSSLPTFVVGLILTLGGWIFGNAFGLAASFGGLYEVISQLTPNAYLVELLFPCYYGITIGTPWLSAAILMAMSAVTMGVMIAIYRQRVTRQA